MKTIRWPETILILSGILLACWQFSLNRGIWLDEASLALNIGERDLFGLLQPLDRGQVAPILYLFLLDGFSNFFGFHEISLRLPSLLAFNLSLLLFHKILKRLIQPPLAILFGLSLFCFNYMLLYYSGELKQYMMDVCVSLFLIYLMIRNQQDGSQSIYVLVGAGILSIFLSNISFLILATVFLMTLVQWLHDRDPESKQQLLYMILGWGSATLLYYVFFVHEHPGRDFMLYYWTRANGFPKQGGGGQALLDFVRQKIVLFRNAKNIFHFRQTELNTALLLIPIGLYLLRSVRKNSFLLLLLLPALLHFLLASLRLYPFEIRLTIYLLPLTILMITLGLDFFFAVLGLKNRFLHWIVLLTCAWQGYVFFNTLMPIRGGEIREAALTVIRKTRPEETLYVFHEARNHIEFYQRTGALRFSRPPVFGKYHQTDANAYVREIESIRSPAWILFTHVKQDMISSIKAALVKNGYRITDSVKTYQASAWRVFHP